MKKLLCLALLVSAGSIYSESISANNKPTDNKSGNNSKDIYKKTWIDFNKNGIKDVYEDPSAPIEARIADLLSQFPGSVSCSTWHLARIERETW